MTIGNGSRGSSSNSSSMSSISITPASTTTTTNNNHISRMRRRGMMNGTTNRKDSDDHPVVVDDSALPVSSSLQRLRAVAAAAAPPPSTLSLHPFLPSTFIRPFVSTRCIGKLPLFLLLTFLVSSLVLVGTARQQFADSFHINMSSMTGSTSTSTSSAAGRTADSSSLEDPFYSQQCSAKYIVQDAYNRFYRPFVDWCQPGLPFAEHCIFGFLNKYYPRNESSTTSTNSTTTSSSSGTTLPWWFEGIFRDNGQLLKDYHKLWFDDPPLRLCRIEKVASTQWKRISFQYYNIPIARNLWDYSNGMRGWTTTTTTTLNNNNHKNGTRVDDNKPGPLVVFFRDPLERFLSAYLDKCEHLSDQGQHCKPVEFQSKLLMRYYSNNNNDIKQSAFSRGVVTGSPNQRRAIFESYVHAFGVEWDVHFVPQAFHCDGLFRTLPNYSFVGSMQEDRFVPDLLRLTDQYLQGTKLMELVRNEFHLPNHTTTTTTKTSSSINKPSFQQIQEHDPHATGATQKLLRYYTNADTVRLLLQYYAIDYVTLFHLEIPAWIQEVLDRDCQERKIHHQEKIQ